MQVSDEKCIDTEVVKLLKYPKSCYKYIKIMSNLDATTPVLYITLGFPGSGKSFFARQHSEAIGAALVDSQRIRYQLFEDPEYSKDEDQVVIAIMDYMIEQFLKSGISVICDGMNHTRVRRHFLREIARRFNAKPLVVWVQTDINTAMHRAMNRDRRGTDDKFARVINDSEYKRISESTKPPQHEDYVVISGKHVFKNQHNAVKKRVDTLINPQTQTIKPINQVSLGGRVDMSRRSSQRSKF